MAEAGSGYHTVLQIIPEHIAEEIMEFQKNGRHLIFEIRLRENRPVTLTCDAGNLVLHGMCTEKHIRETVSRLCGGSLYSHECTIADGYISGGRIRAGVCGRAVCDTHGITAVTDIASINIRIPREIHGAGRTVYELLRKRQFSCGALIYSPPGEGKTTLLRDLAGLLASDGCRRVAVIDSRYELSPESPPALMDVLAGYPRSAGIEIAVRTLNEQYIICDEIGCAADTEAILMAQGSGVPVIASAHADSITDLLSKKHIYPLHQAGIFRIYIGIRRKAGGGYDYTVTEHEGCADRVM